MTSRAAAPNGQGMESLRALIRRHMPLAGLLVALALAMKALVPAGYMLGTQDRVLTVLVCGDAAGQHFTRQIVVPHADPSAPAAKTGETCPYGVLAMGSLGAVPPVVALIALAFALLLGFAPVRVPQAPRVFHLRPPLRGPPVIA